MIEICADCGEPILMNERSYYNNITMKCYHSGCGDPFGHKSAFTAAEAKGFTAGVEAAAELVDWSASCDECAQRLPREIRSLRPPAPPAESEVMPPIVKERCSRCGVVLGDMDKAMAETNRLWRAINGMDTDDADKRA